MSTQSEKLLEAFLDLERSRQREHDLRVETETLLDGLRTISKAPDKDALFMALVQVLHSIIDFEEAFILEDRDEGGLISIASTANRFSGTSWQKKAMFNRVLAGRPAAIFDVELVPEWARQLPVVRDDVKSALHVGLKGGRHDAILVVTHSEPRHFGVAQVKRAKRFAPLISQTLVTLELRREITERDRFFQLSLVLMGIISFAGHFKQVNLAWIDLLGYAKSDLSDRSIFDFIHKEDQKKLSDKLKELEGSDVSVQIEVRFRCQDGSYRWFSCSLADYSDERLVYFIGRDVTERVEARNTLERSNKRTRESIEYAQKIQNSLLPSPEKIARIIPHHFIIWKPRDIVGGDIYTIDSFKNGFIVAAADCTGHGVPGAFMTMIVSSGLRQITVNETCLDPALILKKLNVIINTTLQQDDNRSLSNDGLDAAICFIDKETRKLTFAGARMPLVYVEDGKVKTIKGDRKSVGYRKSDLTYSFTNHTIDLQPDMSFYLYSDGFTDQLGGEKRFQFGNRRLMELLSSIHTAPFEEQKQLVINMINSYLGANSIQDDLTMIGFRVF